MSASPSNTDGLAALQARRATASRKRTLPKSQNPTSLPPYEAPQVPATPEPTPAEEAPTPDRQVPELAPPPANGKAPTRKVGVYLEEPHEDFLEAVRIAGNNERPRVTLSASAVVRMAIDRLMAELSAEEVRDALLAKPLDPSTPGRPRR